MRLKRPERGVDQPTTSSVEVKERVELRVYYPSGLSRLFLGWTFNFTSPLPFLTSLVDGGGWSTSRPGHFTPGEEGGTDRTVGWVDCGEEKLH